MGLFILPAFLPRLTLHPKSGDRQNICDPWLAQALSPFSPPPSFFFFFAVVIEDDRIDDVLKTMTDKAPPGV